MCGIAGIVNWNGLAPTEREAIGPMVAALRHRGPDGSDVYCDRLSALGHTRLSIIDIGAGRQPMCNEDGTIWITFNGEIYNHRELHDRLVARGHHFKTRSDTEAIIHLYEEEGERCVESLRGMFAFAIWDSRRETLFLARDRIGIKPLYYSHDSRRAIFGSELKALLEVPGVSPAIDVHALLDYLTFLFIPQPKSIYRNIFKLPPGHTLTITRSGARLREYWDLEYRDEAPRSDAEWMEAFRDQLGDAVSSHLIADVPVGAFLSGGLDSSAVVAMMARHSTEPTITNSVGFREQEFNEMEFAEQIATKFETRHHACIVTPDLDHVVNRLAWHYDEPFADSSAIPTYYVSHMTRKNVKVALSGDGGDENMAGYRKHKMHHRERMVRDRMSSELRRLTFGSLASIYPKADWLPRILRAKSTLQNLALSDSQAIYHSRAAYDPRIARGLLTDGVRQRVGAYDPFDVIDEPYRRCAASDPINRELYVDIKTYLVDDILTKVDRASMAVGLEVRVPLLDHQFVEFAASIPGRLKVRGGTGKWLFKEAVRPLLTSDVVDRRKSGFCIPLKDWLKGPLREMVEDTVFSPQAQVRSWIDMDRLRRMWGMHLQGARSAEAMIWAVFMLEQWARKFHSGHRSAPSEIAAPADKSLAVTSA